MLFSSIKVDGKKLDMNKATKKRIMKLPAKTLHDYETLQPKRTAGWTSAVGTVAIIRAIKNNTQRIIPCNAVLDGEYGCHGLSMTVPTIIGRDGIHDIKILKLSEEEEETLKHTIDILNHHMRFVENYLDIK